MLLPLLAAQNETWAVDLLGFGFTQRQKEIQYNLNTIKIHLDKFWKTLITQPIILVGASMGGATAIDFTLTYPEVVKALILINSLGYTCAPTWSKYLFPPFDSLAVEYLRQRHILALNIGSILPNLEPKILLAIQCAMLHQEMIGWHEAMISYVKKVIWPGSTTVHWCQVKKNRWLSRVGKSMVKVNTGVLKKP